MFKIEVFARHFIITHLFASDNHVAIRYEVAPIHAGDAFRVPRTVKQFTAYA